MREQHEKAARLWAEQWEASVPLSETHVEETFCVLSPEWEAHFKAEAAKERAGFKALRDELESILARARHIKKILAEGPEQLNDRYASLMCNPPQGVFSFRGSLHFLPDTGHTIMLSVNGEPILETLRKATGEEHAEASYISDRRRQLSMFPEAETALESQSDPEAAPSPASAPENATAGDSDQLPF